VWIVGSIVGLAGGVIGTYFSIKNTKGPRERAFTVKSAVVYCSPKGMDTLESEWGEVMALRKGGA
jgi:hypothetical protein